MAIHVSLPFAPRLRLWLLFHFPVMTRAILGRNNGEPNISTVDHHHFESGQSQIRENHSFRFRCANSTCSLYLTLPQRKNLFLQRARDQIPQTSEWWAWQWFLASVPKNRSTRAPVQTSRKFHQADSALEFQPIMRRSFNALRLRPASLRWWSIHQFLSDRFTNRKASGSAP